MNIQKLKNLYDTESGFTITKNFNKCRIKKGFCVSLTNNKGHNIKRLLGLLYKVKINLKGYTLFLGGWKEAGSKTYYLDYTIIEKNKTIALNLARLFNQKAIYDLNKQETIYLNDN